MPIQSCGQSFSTPRGKAGFRLNAHTELRSERQRLARQAIYRNRPVPNAFNVGLIGSTCTTLPRRTPTTWPAARVLQSFPFQLKLSSSLHHVTQLKPQFRRDMFLCSPRNRGSINSRIATWSDFRRVGRGILEMDSSDGSNGIRIRHHVFDTRPDTEFNS
jgi:hypothetical protein